MEIHNYSSDCIWAILYEVSCAPLKPNAPVFLQYLIERIQEFSSEEIDSASCDLIYNGYLVGKYRQVNGHSHLTYISGITEKGLEYIS